MTNQSNPSVTAASTIGRDLLEAMVLELKMLPKPWPALTKHQQDDVINRMRKRVVTSVAQAVHIIASDGRAVADATLKKVVFKGGITAEFELSKTCPTRHQLADAEGKLCLIVVADPAEYLADMDGVKGESDQRAMDLGTEYAPDSDGSGMSESEAGDVVDATWRLTDDSLQSDLDKAYEAGRMAASQGDTKDAAPQADYRLVARWTQGWSDWHATQAAATEEQTGGAADEDDELLEQAVQIVVSQRRASISFLQRKLGITYNHAARLIEQMERDGVVSTPDGGGARTVLRGSEGAIE